MLSNNRVTEEDQDKTTTQVDKASLAPIFDDIEDELDTLLSTTKAFAIAKTKSYPYSF